MKQLADNFYFPPKHLQWHPDIIQDDHPILRLVATPVVDFDGQTTKDTLSKMFSGMFFARGAGIAAPQIGESTQIIMYNSDSYHYMINPVILAKSEEVQLHNEGCLSSTAKGFVSRALQITVQYYTQDGKQYTDTFSGFTATVIQHEIDHLNGILFTDYL